MGGPLSRPAALVARLEAPVEEWPYLDEGTLLKTRSRKFCMTCHWFRHHAGVNCIPVLVNRHPKLHHRFASLSVTFNWCRDRIGHFHCLRPLSG